MAVTVHREPNQVKWIGVRPGHNGEQILEHGTANNATVIIYTVPADKLLLLYGFSYNVSGTAGNTGFLSIYTAVPAVHRHLVYGNFSANTVVAFGRDFVIPIEIPAAYSVRVLSPAATKYVGVSINGILIDV